MNLHESLDSFIASDNDKISRSGVITVRVSDHLLTYYTQKIKRVFKTNKNDKLRSSKHYIVSKYSILRVA